MSITAADMTACRHTLTLSANGSGLLPGQDQGRGGQEKKRFFQRRTVNFEQHTFDISVSFN